MSKYADSLFISEAIFTANAFDPISGAVAVDGNRILEVGSVEELKRFEGPDTKVFDCGDRLIMPGFNDAHVHQFMAARALDTEHHVSLGTCTSKAECLDRIREFAATYPDNPWINGSGWNNDKWTDGTAFPDRTELDEIIPDRPVYLLDWGAHSAWVNKAALDLAGYTKDTPDPPGGVIGRFENGEPNGLVQEVSAMDPIAAISVQDTDFKGGLIKIMEEAVSSGITSLGEVYPFGYGMIDERALLEVLKELEDEGRLKCRHHVFTELVTDLSKPKEYRRDYNSSLLRIAGLKLLTDGAYEGHTAFTLEPYADTPDFCSCLQQDADELREMVVNADKAGFPVRLHAIGTASVRNALDCYEAALRANGNKGLRHTVEHMETVTPEDVGRFAELGVVASMQPLHCLFSIDIFEGIVGAKLKPYYPVKRMLDSKAIVAYGTDFPIIPKLRPLDGIFTAITRQTKEGYPEGGFEPSQKISLGQALQAYTKGSAIAENFDSQIGTLEAGKLADLIILDKNLFRATPKEILETEVLLTVMDGKITYQNPSQPFTS